MAKGFAFTKRFDGKFLLTGLLRCPQCGAAMTASVTELDDFDRELFSGRLGELDTEREQFLTRKSEIEFELNGDNSQTLSYEQVRSLIERFEYLLQQSSFDQRKTLLYLIIQKITLNDKGRIDKIELAFDESTEQHFLSVAPSADMAEVAFPLSGDAQTLNHKLIFAICFTAIRGMPHPSGTPLSFLLLH
jgi:hypothetical protein